MRFDISLSNFKPAESGTCRVTGDQLIVTEGRGHGLHIVRASDPRIGSNRIRVTVTYKPTESCNTDLFLEHVGWVLVCRLTRNGQIADSGYSQQIAMTQDYDGCVVASVTYWSADHRVGIGTTRGTDLRSHGDGQDQYIIQSVSVEIVQAEHVQEEDRIVFVDVGARGGFSQSMQLRGALVRPILFEPEPEEADGLRRACSAWSGAQVHERALSNITGPRKLYFTRNPGCSSLLPPNTEFLRSYPEAPAFEVVKEIDVDCVRYDELFQHGKAPAPDAIKIDVQGAEYLVLEGFGDLLQGCLGVELECHTYPLYHGERLISDLTTLLARFGLMLYRLRKVDHFLSEWIEFDAWFIRPDRLLDKADKVAAAKLAAIKKAWEL